MSIDRQCSSGLMAIATAAKQIIVDRHGHRHRRRRRVDLEGPDGSGKMRVAPDA
jgi:acetyl-CoA C-acetyltransferase